MVDYWAPWCKNCKKVSPTFSKLATELTSVAFVKVNTVDAETLAAEQSVNALPTFQFFKSGKKIGEFKGSDASALEKAIRGHL